MKCPSCQSEISDESRFCSKCGARIGEEKLPCPGCGREYPAGERFCSLCGLALTAAKPAVTPPPGAPAPQEAPKATGIHRKVSDLTVVIIIAAILFAILIAVIIVIPLVIRGSSIRAEIRSVEIKGPEGDVVDAGSVPLDEDLYVEVEYLANFGDGEGELIVAFDLEDGEIPTGKEDVTSSGNPQTWKSRRFSFDESRGRTQTVTARLVVEAGGKKAQDEESLEFEVVAGKGEKKELDEARRQASDKLAAAEAAINEISTMGIAVGDLQSQLVSKKVELGSAGTLQEVREVEQFAENVVAECNARKQAFLAEQERQRQEEARRAKEVEARAGATEAMKYYVIGLGAEPSVTINDFSWNNDSYTSATGVAFFYAADASTHTMTLYATRTGGGDWVVRE